MVKKGNKKLTLSINKNILKEFKKLCEEEGWKVSKKIEKYMEGVLINR